MATGEFLWRQYGLFRDFSLPESIYSQSLRHTLTCEASIGPDDLTITLQDRTSAIPFFCAIFSFGSVVPALTMTSSVGKDLSRTIGGASVKHSQLVRETLPSAWFMTWKRYGCVMFPINEAKVHCRIVEFFPGLLRVSSGRKYPVTVVHL